MSRIIESFEKWNESKDDSNVVIKNKISNWLLDGIYSSIGVNKDEINSEKHDDLVEFILNDLIRDGVDDDPQEGDFRMGLVKWIDRNNKSDLEKTNESNTELDDLKKLSKDIKNKGDFGDEGSSVIGMSLKYKDTKIAGQISQGSISNEKYFNEIIKQSDLPKDNFNIDFGNMD